jgi:hypothetical protein
MTFTVPLKGEKNDIYIPKYSILKEMVAKLSELSQHFFFDLVREPSDSTSYLSKVINSEKFRCPPFPVQLGNLWSHFDNMVLHLNQ